MVEFDNVNVFLLNTKLIVTGETRYFWPSAGLLKEKLGFLVVEIFGMYQSPFIFLKKFVKRLCKYFFKNEWTLTNLQYIYPCTARSCM